MSSRNCGPKSKLHSKNTVGSTALSFLVHDFIPNRFRLSDWISLTYFEDDSAFIGDLVDDIVTNVLDQCEKVHRKKQLMPFTLTHTKNVLLPLIEWYFTAHDVGEINEKDWQEKEEPQPTRIDSWAKGSVPVVVYPRQPSKPTTPVNSEAKSESELEACDSVHPDTSCPEKVASRCPRMLWRSLIKCKRKGFAFSFSPKVQSCIRSCDMDGNASFGGKVSQKDEVVLPPVKTTRRSTKSRPRYNDDVLYDENGYIIEVKKIPTKDLPQLHQVNVSYRVLPAENDAESIKSKLNRQDSTRGETSRRRRSILLRQLTDKYSTSFLPEVDKRCDEDSQTQLDIIMPTMVEAVAPCPGVVVKEDILMKKGLTEEQQMLIGSCRERRRRYLKVNVSDTAQLRLLPRSPHVKTIQRHSVLPAITTKRNVEASYS